MKTFTIDNIPHEEFNSINDYADVFANEHFGSIVGGTLYLQRHKTIWAIPVPKGTQNGDIPHEVLLDLMSGKPNKLTITCNSDTITYSTENESQIVGWNHVEHGENKTHAPFVLFAFDVFHPKKQAVPELEGKVWKFCPNFPNSAKNWSELSYFPEVITDGKKSVKCEVPLRSHIPQTVNSKLFEGAVEFGATETSIIVQKDGFKVAYSNLLNLRN